MEFHNPSETINTPGEQNAREETKTKAPADMPATTLKERALEILQRKVNYHNPLELSVQEGMLYGQPVYHISGRDGYGKEVAWVMLDANGLEIAFFNNSGNPLVAPAPAPVHNDVPQPSEPTATPLPTPPAQTDETLPPADNAEAPSPIEVTVNVVMPESNDPSELPVVSVYVDTSHADVEVETKGNEVDVEVETPHAEVEVETYHGSVEVEVETPHAEVEVETNHGSVEVEVETPHAEVEVETNHGSVEVEVETPQAEVAVDTTQHLVQVNVANPVETEVIANVPSEWPLDDEQDSVEGFSETEEQLFDESEEDVDQYLQEELQTIVPQRVVVTLEALGMEDIRLELSMDTEYLYETAHSKLLRCRLYIFNPFHHLVFQQITLQNTEIRNQDNECIESAQLKLLVEKSRSVFDLQPQSTANLDFVAVLPPDSDEHYLFFVRFTVNALLPVNAEGHATFPLEY